MSDDDEKNDTEPAVATNEGALRYSTFKSTGEEHERERWSSRTAFYLAAIGSAVGFGNVWRFPALAKTYGGGACKNCQCLFVPCSWQ